jgi:hypothetical protein
MDGLSLLRQAGLAGLAVRAEDDKLVIRGPKRAEPVARLLLAHKFAVIGALAADWQAHYGEALVYWSALHPAREAARLAWGELEDRWHRRHGRRCPVWQCPGCGSPIGSLPALDLTDRNRVHLDDAHGLDCLLGFGGRWRSEATAGLRTLGLDPPPDNKAL